MTLPVRTSSKSPLSSLLALLVATGILVATFLLATGTIHYDFPNDDTVVYGLIARLWSEGLLPYRDVYDFKPPLIYSFFRGCFALWGTYPQAIWEGFMWLTGIAAVAILFAAQRLRLPAFGIGASLAFALIYWTSPLGLSREQVLNTEGLASLMLAGAWACILFFHQSVRRVWALGSGIFLGLAFTSKQPALAFALPLLAHIVIAHREAGRPRSAIALIATMFIFIFGATLPTLAVIGYYALHGALPELYFWAWEANLTYAGGRQFGTMERWYAFVGNITIFAKIILTPRALPFLIALIILPVCAVRHRTWLTTTVSLWLLGAILTLIPCTQAGVRHYLAFFQFPLALAVGHLSYITWGALTSRYASTVFASFIALCIPLATFGVELLNVRHEIAKRPPSIDRSKLAAQTDSARELQSLAGPSRKILFEGTNLFPLFQSGLIPASKYIYAIPMSIIPPQQYVEEFLAQVKAADPSVALLTHYSPEVYNPAQESTYGKIGAYLTQNFDPPRPAPIGTVFIRKTNQPPAQ